MLDKLSNFTAIKRQLDSQGGYAFTCTGQLSRKFGEITFIESDILFLQLYFFLSFINGARTAPRFIKGLNEDKVTWANYHAYRVDIYRPVWSWSSMFDTAALSDMWTNFRTLCVVDDDYECISTAIHWYIESNRTAGAVEGSIALVQNALELLFNWQIVEKHQQVTAKNARNMKAADKIRLLVTHVSIDPAIPRTLTHAVQFSKGAWEGAELFVTIRNCIVHSQDVKRQLLSTVSKNVLLETYELGMWYLELSLLFILNYKGKYVNRCVRNNYSQEIDVPWITPAL